MGSYGLLAEFEEVNTNESTLSGSDLFINFINKLEGYKTKCKNLHWSAPKKYSCISR